jgi:hypothetical protein
MNTKKQTSCCRRFREHRTRPLSEADVLKPEEVACALSKNRKTTRAWLAENRLIRMVLGSPRVIWGEVLQLIRGKKGTQTPKMQKTEQIDIPLTDEF